MNTRDQQLQAIDRLLTIMDELRVQCPWDKKQTFDSLRHLTIEETYELSDALLANDNDEIFFLIEDQVKKNLVASSTGWVPCGAPEKLF